MCGICGVAYVDSGARPEREVVLRMREALAHRGPDGAGLVELPGVTLAHRRLSIIDLEGGDQPMANEDETVWVVFNGEIYNYLQLRAELIREGHRFRTHSDTEVLVHAYEEFGESFVHRLNGMFGFALMDVKRSRLLLVRDALGIKPLFYAATKGGIVFASEIKAVVAGLNHRCGMRHQSLQEYLVFRYVAWDRTFFEGVQRLPPGHMGIWEKGKLAIRRYWSPPILDQPADLELDDAAHALDQHLERAVGLQLVSDVPLGAFCSGGVDSGLVTVFAAPHSAEAFQTFSVGFDDPSWDETPLARDTAQRVGAEHHVVLARADGLEQMLRQLIRYHDEPLSHPNSVPLFQLSELARQRVKVVLTGEGADELFGGYPRYHLARLSGWLRGIPRSGRSTLGALLRAVPGHRAEKAAMLLPPPLDEAILLNSAYVNPELVSALTGCSVDGALEGRRQLVAETLVSRDPVGSLSRYELLTYLTCALDRMDRMSMAHGLEGRVPFLDLQLVEWGLSLPSGLNLGARSNKRVVKRLAQGRLSPQVVHGPKSGFGLPLDSWFRGPELGSMLERMEDPRHPAAGSFHPKVLRDVLRAHHTAAARHGELLWLLANVFLWAEEHA